MTYDAFDSMSNLMKHLSGEGAAMKSLDLDKPDHQWFGFLMKTN